MKQRLTAVLLGAVIVLGGMPASGQERPAPAPAAFSESELGSFVRAAAAVQRINADFEERVKAASSEQEQRELVVAASIQQNAAVTSHGLTADRYEQIIARIDTDPAFAQLITERLRAQ